MGSTKTVCVANVALKAFKMNIALHLCATYGLMFWKAFHGRPYGQY